MKPASEGARDGIAGLKARSWHCLRPGYHIDMVANSAIRGLAPRPDSSWSRGIDVLARRGPTWPDQFGWPRTQILS